MSNMQWNYPRKSGKIGQKLEAAQPAPQAGASPRVDALMAQWDDDGATRGAAFIELRDLARQLEAEQPAVQPSEAGHPCAFHLVPWTGCESCDRRKAIFAPSHSAVMQQALDALLGVRSNMLQNAPHLSGKVWGDADAAIAALSATMEKPNG